MVNRAVQRAALGFSLLMTWFVLAQPGHRAPDARSVVVYGLLLQDVLPAGSPNGAFWSIAVQAQLYVLLPLLLTHGAAGERGAWGPAIGCLLVAVATSRPRPLVRLLDARPLRALGSFSYSLYLTHAPIVIAVAYGLVLGRVRPGAPTFLVLSAILLPVTVGFARLFAAVFELPFQRHRGWAPLLRSMAGRPHRPGGYPGDLPAKSS